MKRIEAQHPHITCSRRSILAKRIHNGKQRDCGVVKKRGRIVSGRVMNAFCTRPDLGPPSFFALVILLHTDFAPFYSLKARKKLFLTMKFLCDERTDIFVICVYMPCGQSITKKINKCKYRLGLRGHRCHGFLLAYVDSYELIHGT